MSYDVLVAIVLINAAVTVSLWRQVATKADKPAKLSKKAAKALWHSEPIVPRHDPPKVVGDGYAFVNDVERAFFTDFKEFADVVNWWLADKHVASRFRLQDMPDGTVGIDYVPDGSMDPIPGRCFALYHNQTRLGRLEIHPSFPEYTTQTPKVYTSVHINRARYLGSPAITEFLDIVASHVASPNPKTDEYGAARQCIQAALTETLWTSYVIRQPDYEDWGELEVSFVGSAEWYIRRRSAWHNAGATNKGADGRAPKK
jgi:hypothetical protein